MEQMRAEIEDLEALKELSDELEESHVETEKALQEEIGGTSSFVSVNQRLITFSDLLNADEKDMLIHTHLRAIEALQDSIEDYDNTIGQFRELVATLQRCARQRAISLANFDDHLLLRIVTLTRRASKVNPISWSLRMRQHRRPLPLP